jgi:hypothetical protein
VRRPDVTQQAQQAADLAPQVRVLFHQACLLHNQVLHLRRNRRLECCNVVLAHRRRSADGRPQPRGAARLPRCAFLPRILQGGVGAAVRAAASWRGQPPQARLELLAPLDRDAQLSGQLPLFLLKPHHPVPQPPLFAARRRRGASNGRGLRALAGLGSAAAWVAATEAAVNGDEGVGAGVGGWLLQGA